MAKVTGISCDVCGDFAATANGALRPATWMRVSIGTSADEGFDICSNKCLAALGRQRQAADREMAAPPPAAVPDQKGKGSEGQRAWARHLGGHRNRGIVDPECDYCDRETSADPAAATA